MKTTIEINEKYNIDCGKKYCEHCFYRDGSNCEIFLDSLYYNYKKLGEKNEELYFYRCNRCLKSEIKK